MKFLIHNKINIKIADREYEFFNKMLSSVYDRLEQLENYFNFIAIGTQTNLNIENDFKLANHKASYLLSFDSHNFDIKNEILFSKKVTLISDSRLDDTYLTEAGITATAEDNPTIYNYFSLINNEFPKGIFKPKGESIEIGVTIYLQISSLGDGLLTAGENPLIKFLLGEGSGNKNFCAVRGNNFLDNTLVNREKPFAENIYPCTINISKGNSLTISFESNMLFGDIHEIVFLLDEIPFARYNVENLKEPITENQTFISKENYILDLGKDINEVLSITNNKTGETEHNYFCSKYATDFGDKISLPFNNLFDAETPRFLSKDGNKIFFILDDAIYAYQNLNYNITEIKTFGIAIQNIFKIVSFDKYVFIFSKTEPFLSAYIIEYDSLLKANVNFSNYDNYSDLGNMFDVDVTLAKNGIFMLGYISRNYYNGIAIYFNYNETENTFNFDSYQKSEYRFTYVLAMYKNNFSDASIFFLKGAENSYDCKIVTFNPDKTFTDVYSVLCYYYTKDTKEIHTKGRAVVVEKTTSPHLWIYFYPQMYRYNLELLGDELDDYVSTNMLYLIQKTSENNFQIYNLVGYNTPTKFVNGLPSEIDQSKIESFEFLNNILLIFSSDSKNKIYAYSLKEDSMLVENISDNNTIYTTRYKKLNLIGSNNEGVNVTLTLNIKL